MSDTISTEARKRQRHLSMRMHQYFALPCSTGAAPTNTFHVYREPTAFQRPGTTAQCVRRGGRFVTSARHFLETTVLRKSDAYASDIRNVPEPTRLDKTGITAAESPHGSEGRAEAKRCQYGKRDALGVIFLEQTHDESMMHMHHKFARLPGDHAVIASAISEKARWFAKRRREAFYGLSFSQDRTHLSFRPTVSRSMPA